MGEPPIPKPADHVGPPDTTETVKLISIRIVTHLDAQPSPHFSYSEINALPLNGQQAVTAISALWLRRSTAFRWLQQPIGRHLMIDVVEQVIERHQEVKNEGISEISMALAAAKATKASPIRPWLSKVAASPAILYFVCLSSCPNICRATRSAVCADRAAEARSPLWFSIPPI